ncbi:UNVERIFIED_CONTAM: hypothetical protein HDU68_004928 [Siphonaria sp. JEL0065]|nr:hypothetical protein HDU68_004928 [Siphonaria sp. JEL0065]
MRTIVALLFAANAFAHFLIDVPVSRFFDEEKQPQAPCGGQSLGARTNFPISGGSIKGLLLHPTGTAQFSIVITNSDPLTSQFGKILIGPGPNVKVSEGAFSSGPIDLTGIPGVVDGASATIQVVMNTVDGVFYVCSDVMLVGNSVASPAHTTTTTTTTTAFSRSNGGMPQSTTGVSNSQATGIVTLAPGSITSTTTVTTTGNDTSSSGGSGSSTIGIAVGVATALLIAIGVAFWWKLNKGMIQPGGTESNKASSKFANDSNAIQPDIVVHHPSVLPKLQPPPLERKPIPVWSVTSVPGYYCATEDYTPDNDREFALTNNMRLYVVTMPDEDGWCKANSGRQEGWVHASRLGLLG